MGDGREASGPTTVRRALTALLVVALALAGGTASAQRTIDVQPAGPRLYGDSWAVVIGINDYQHPRIPKLRYAVNDARSVEQALRAQGFRPDRIIRLLEREATKARIETVLGDDLRRRVGPNDRLLIFFAGHGVTEPLRSGEEEGYLIPADGDPGRLFGTAISMTSLRQISDRLRAKHILYVVDACYSGYALFNRSIGSDLLDEMTKKPAIQILTAGRQGDQAQERGGHGVFTEVLVRGLQGEAFNEKEWLALEELGVWVKQRVYAESNKKQLPQYGNISGEGQFVFLRPGTQIAAVPPRPAPARPEPPKPLVREEVPVGALALVASVDGVEVFVGDRRVGETKPGRTLVVENLIAGQYRVTARKAGHRDWERDVQVAANQRAEVAIDIEPLRDEPARAEPGKVVTGEDGAEMVQVPAGEFWMGSDDGDDDEKPRRRVSVDAFAIDRREVTNALFERFVRATRHKTTAEREERGWAFQRKDGQPSWLLLKRAWWQAPAGPGSSAAPSHPVVHVSWQDADTYCRWASKRLPTEAEWEKAARGPDGRKYPWGDQWDGSRANSWDSGLGKTAQVGAYPTGASPYGVHDMAGNVWEWVVDWYDGASKSTPERNPTGPATGRFKVIRGGSWFNHPGNLRAALRNFALPGTGEPHVGFRCAKGAQ